jgi:hypothetical protein
MGNAGAGLTIVAKGLRCKRHRYRCDRPRYLSETPHDADISIYLAVLLT